MMVLSLSSMVLELKSEVSQCSSEVTCLHRKRQTVPSILGFVWMDHCTGHVDSGRRRGRKRKRFGGECLLW